MLVRLRVRLLKTSVHLPMGQYEVSAAHVKHILDTEPRLSHELTATDLSTTDKMNFRAVVRLTSESTLRCIRKQDDATATELYLTLMKDISDAFINQDTPVLRRISLIWRVVFFLRAWRAWLVEEGYSVQDNFITMNAFVCLELNAHGLLLSVRHLRDAGRPELFLPTLFCSQPCESGFRDVRSQTSFNWTAVNVSMRELLRRAGRIELQAIIASQLADEFIFPRYFRINLS